MGLQRAKLILRACEGAVTQDGRGSVWRRATVQLFCVPSVRRGRATTQQPEHRQGQLIRERAGCGSRNLAWPRCVQSTQAAAATAAAAAALSSCGGHGHSWECFGSLQYTHTPR